MEKKIISFFEEKGHLNPKQNVGGKESFVLRTQQFKLSTR